MSKEIKIMSQPPMNASKWLEAQALIDTNEMEGLFKALEPFEIFINGSIVEPGQGLVEKSYFLKVYDDYINSLKNGILPDENKYRQMFSSVFTTTTEAICAVPLANGKHLMRVITPVVQLQPHQMAYSEGEQKFYPMVFGKNCLIWGIQFMYPQLFQDPNTNEVSTVLKSPNFPNTPLFKNLQRWVRNNTIPTSFLTKDQTINISVRLGKNCLEWINNHPQLESLHLKVKTYGY